MLNEIHQDPNVISRDEIELVYLMQEPRFLSERKKAIIFLHGVGSNESDLFRFADALPEDFFVISVRGLFSLGINRHAWYNVDFSSGKPVIKPHEEALSRKAIIKFIKQVKERYQLDEIYLGGFSQGAIMSYSVGLTEPGIVTGIVAISGRLLPEIKPFVSQHDSLNKLRVFVAHGQQDGTLPIHYAEEAKDYLKTLCVPLSYHTYDMGHQINQDVLGELVLWLNNNAVTDKDAEVPENTSIVR